MKKFIHFQFLVLISIFVLSTFSSFDSFTPVWSSASNILKPVRAGNTVSYSTNNNGWLFIVSGRDQNDEILKTVQRYNVNTNSWDTLNPHPTGLLGAATAILKDSLYIIGGVVNPPGAGQEIVYKFSINENTWSTVANLPVTLVDAKGVSYQDSLIYAAGGVGGGNEGHVFLYNSISDSWRTATPFPSIGRRSFGGFAITGDTLIYMCGTIAFGSSTYFDSVYVGVISQTDRAVISWTRGANFPGQTRTFFDACSWGNKGIIMTGGSTDNTFNTSSNECYSFSPGRNQWTQLPGKPTAWLTGQSGSAMLANHIWKLICASGYNNAYLTQTEILTDTLFTVGINNNNSQLPGQFILSQNYPNPFNPATNLEFGISDLPARNQNGLENVNSGGVFVSLKVYDVLGKEVTTLVKENLTPGTYKYNFDASGLTNGIYFYTLNVNEYTETKRMVLVK